MTELATPRRLRLKIELPAELPEKPVGWTKVQRLHMKVAGGGIGVYDIRDADGNVMPFGYQYNTATHGLTGFTLPDRSLEGAAGVVSWRKLREWWPGYYATLE